MSAINMENSIVADLDRIFGDIAKADFSMNPVKQMVDQFDENGNTLGYPHFFGAPFEAVDATKSQIREDEIQTIAESKAKQILGANGDSTRVIEENDSIYNSPYFGQNPDLNVWKQAVNQIEEKGDDFIPADFVPIEVM